jgi:peptidoglycan-associated lipoprotein
MHNKLLSAIALGVLLAGCECSPETTNMEAGSAPVPGSAEDFKANVKDRVFFAFNKHHISAESEHVLEAQAAWFKTYANTTATIEGHADARGTREYNLALGQRRAHAAQHALTKHGVEESRLSTISYGKDRPFVPDATTEEAHAQNRVAVTVVK